MSDFTISVDFSNAYSNKRVTFSRSIVKVDVNDFTAISKIKEVVLKHLNLPYNDLYFLELKGRKLEDGEIVAGLGMSGKTVLILRCKDIDALYGRLRKDNRL